ncbi:MAG TPA: HAMP domain-containing sensor histidine kinase [Gemmatimonadales bacterium]|nr:HAMP domain-containing sensor histidine kinase [Gemmatimonadales bacterium]
MSFRWRLFVISTLAVLLPLAVLALGVRREMDRRLGEESSRRGAVAVARLGAELAGERERLVARLQALGRDLAADNRFRLGLLGESGARTYVLDWASGAMRLSGLSLLQVQDSAGRIVTSGHFRNEYDEVRPEIPRFLAAVRPSPSLLRARTAEAPLLVLAAAESAGVAGRPLTLVGGIAAEERFLRGLDPDPDLTVALAAAGADSAGGAVVGELTLPFLDASTGSADSARLVVTQSATTLAALRQGLNTWVLVALGTTALLAILLNAWLARVVSRPLTELAHRTASIDLDRLDQDFATERTDEIGALSRLLGEMTLRLRRAVAGLREAERRVAMGDIARQVNHDIKNGLVPIRNVLRHLDQIAREEPAALPGVFQERKGTLESSVAYLDTLARNYARLAPAASPGQCDVNALVAEVLHAPRGGPPIHTRLAGALPSVGVDRLMLRRVLENLVGNAADAAAEREGATVTVSTERASRDGRGSVRIHVTDTGSGMTRAELDRAFDDFYTTKTGGSGLGLSIVRRLVLDLGGTLRIDTEPGTGTRATVEIPL